MDHETKELVRQIGANTEAAGRMLQSKRELTLDDLTCLQETFRLAGQTLNCVKDIEISRHS
jgi:antitoxin component HigA of HigAB toxin-antitoxin module